MRSPRPAVAFRLEILRSPAVSQARQAVSAERAPDKLGFQIASPILAKRARMTARAAWLLILAGSSSTSSE